VKHGLAAHDVTAHDVAMIRMLDEHNEQAEQDVAQRCELHEQFQYSMALVLILISQGSPLARQ